MYIYYIIYKCTYIYYIYVHIYIHTYIYIYPPKSIPQLFKNHLFLTKKISHRMVKHHPHPAHQWITTSNFGTLQKVHLLWDGKGKSRNISVEASGGSISSMEIIVFLTKHFQRNLSETKWLKKNMNTNSPTKNPWTNTSQVLNICSGESMASCGLKSAMDDLVKGPGCG